MALTLNICFKGLDTVIGVFDSESCNQTPKTEYLMGFSSYNSGWYDRFQYLCRNSYKKKSF